MCGVAGVETLPVVGGWQRGCWGGGGLEQWAEEMVEKEVGEELRGWMEGRGSAWWRRRRRGGVEALFTRHLSKLVLISVTQLA